MKRNDIDKLNRELKRQEKHEKTRSKHLDGGRGFGVREYAKHLVDLLRYDDNHIYNTREDESILDLMIDMKEELPEEQWDIVLKKAIRMTKVSEKDLAFHELKAALDS